MTRRRAWGEGEGEGGRGRQGGGCEGAERGGVTVPGSIFGDGYWCRDEATRPVREGRLRGRLAEEKEEMEKEKVGVEVVKGRKQQGKSGGAAGGE